MIGQSVGHYRITAKLGAGGMGEVFLAEDTRLERKAAIKFLPAEMAADPERHALLPECPIRKRTGVGRLRSGHRRSWHATIDTHCLSPIAGSFSGLDGLLVRAGNARTPGRDRYGIGLERRPRRVRLAVIPGTRLIAHCDPITQNPNSSERNTLQSSLAANPSFSSRGRSSSPRQCCRS